ncbi:MAG: alpha/beta hydrolase [Myxococcota bacterium]
MQKIPRWIRLIVLPILMAMVLMVMVLLVSRWVLQRQQRQHSQVLLKSGVEELFSVALGGWKQWVFVRGKHKKAPLLLWLHDGPGGPSGMVFSRAFETPLLDHFLVAHWEQRGTGKSFSRGLSASTMSVAQFRRDLVALVEHLCTRYKRKKIFLVGHGWGSTLGLWYASKYPQKLWAYVGVSQILDWLKHWQEAYTVTLKRARKVERQEAIEKLSQLGAPPYTELSSLRLLQRWVAEFGGYMHRYPEFGKIFKASLSSPEYTLRDLWVSGQAYQFSSQHLLLPAIRRVKLSSIQKVEAPLWFADGQYSLLSGGKQLQRWFARVQAPKKAIKNFDASGFSPHREQAAVFYRWLIQALNGIQHQRGIQKPLLRLNRTKPQATE